MAYFRPLAQVAPVRPKDALPLAGGWAWFERAEVLSRRGVPEIVAASDIPGDVVERLTAPRADIAGLSFGAPRLMGILNTTPDSFSDGGQFDVPAVALVHARAMAASGADIIDVGGESTRPGADLIDIDEETRRTAPIIAAMRAGLDTPISIDTRKASVAQAAVVAGANLVNDVSGFTFDAALAPYCAESGLPVCVMHAQGDPQTMQKNPQYDDVLLDVYDYLAARVEALVSLGIARSQIIVDPGIGFGKTQAHNLALLAGLSLFHGLGCPVLLGASRKRFIGDISGAASGAPRAPGSIGVALAGAAQGVQVLRVHDVVETRGALTLWQAATMGRV
ncbi:MAG: dihydropteroate synthase [Roseovarius sp.]